MQDEYIPTPPQYESRDAWLEDWQLKHSDTYHPSSRHECTHCQVMIQLYGPMPAPDELMWYKRQHRQPKQGRSKQRISSALRKAVYERDAYRCQRCGSWENLSVDHIIPESKNGPSTLENLQTFCMSCNAKKGNRE